MAILRFGSKLADERSRLTSSAGGGGGGAVSTASYWVLEEDGTSKWQKEEGDGFWITEEST